MSSLARLKFKGSQKVQSLGMQSRTMLLFYWSIKLFL